MSWMFDRLCEIAVADEVEVIAAVSPLDDPHALDEWSEVLARASTVPQLGVTTMPPGVPPSAVLGPELRAVDLEDCGAGAVVDVMRRSLVDADRRAMAVRVWGGRAAIRTIADGSSSISLDASRRLVVATDLAGSGDLLRDAGRHGLGVAVRGVDPDAQVKVDSFLGVVSIIDALVTLRMFAFGADRDAGSDRSVGRPTPAPPLSLRRVS
jgi:hypothetical protein